MPLHTSQEIFVSHRNARLTFQGRRLLVDRVRSHGMPVAHVAKAIAALCQIRQPSSEGRRYFERKVDEGKTKKEALRALKRQISNTVYRQLLVDSNQ